MTEAHSEIRANHDMRRMMVLLIALTIAFLAPFVIWGHAWEWSIDQAPQQLRPYGALSTPMAFLLLVCDLFLPIPATAVMAGLGGLYGPWLGNLIGNAGTFCSGFLAYTVCRRYGQKAVYTLLSKDEQTQGHQLFHDYGGWILALSRWLPLLPEVVACMAGFFHMTARSVALAILVGGAPMALTFAWVGHLGEGNPTRPLLISALTPPNFCWWIGKRLTRIYGTERKSTP